MTRLLLPPPGAWYEIRALFAPELTVAAEEETLPACRILECLDMHDSRPLRRRFVNPPPATLNSGELTACLEEVVRHHGPPARGVSLDPSVWLSSAEMLSRGETLEQGRRLLENGVAFASMSRADRAQLQEWSARRGLRCEFEREHTLEGY